MKTLQNRNLQILQISPGIKPDWFEPFLYHGAELQIGPDELLGVLNGKGKRSRQLVTFVQEIKSLRQSEPLRRKEVDAFYKRLDRVNEIMRGCSLHPHLEVANRDFGLQWQVRADLRRVSGLDLFRLIVALLDHRGEFESLDQCKMCGNWYIRRKRWQENCSLTCRRKAYRRTPTYREKNRIARRKYYWEKLAASSRKGRK